MGISDKIDNVISKIENAKKRIELKSAAKAKYKSLNGNLTEKNPCGHCMEMTEDIHNGDNIVVVKRKPKPFCTDPWHETVGQVQEIDDQIKKMTYLGYDNSVTGFDFTKYCPYCWRIIYKKQF